MPRLNRKRLIEIVNQQFNKNVDNQWKAVDIKISRPSRNEIEGGACRLVVVVENGCIKDPLLRRQSLFCFYTLAQLDEHLQSGYEIYLKSKGDMPLISQIEIDLRKIIR